MSTDGLHFDITADGDQADSELAALNARLTQLESAFKGSGEGASYSSEGFKLARESLANYDRGIQASIALQQSLQAEGKDTAALRAEEAQMLRGYAAEASALTTKRMAEIAAEAEAQKLSVKQQIFALEELKAAVAGSAVNVSKVEAAIARLGGSAGVFGGIKKGVQDLEEHSRTAAIAFGAMGMNGEAAVAKVAGLGQLLNGMGDAVPGLLAVGAALVGIFAAFEGLKSSAEAASEWQQRLAVLGQTVRNQGGDWKSLTKDVREWADAQEATTQFSRGQAVQGLTELTSTGMKLADAMTVTRVAEDASAASGQSLQSVEHGLMEAMHGRTQALTALGIGTKKSIHDGMAFRDVLKAIEQHMGGAAAAAADTYAGKFKQLQTALHSVQEDIGSAILPSLTGLAQGLLNLVENAKTVFSQWEESIKKWMATHKQAVDGITAIIKGLAVAFRAAFDVVAVIINSVIKEIGELASFVLDFASGDWKNAWQDVVNFAGTALHSFTDLFGNWGDNIIKIAERIGEGVKKALTHVFAAMSDASHGDISGATSELGQVGGSFGGVMSGIKFAPFKDAFSGMQDLFSHHGAKVSNGFDIGSLSSGLADTMVGGGTGGHHGGKMPFLFDPGALQLKSPVTAELAAGKDKVTSALEAMKLKEAELQKAMESTTTAAGYEAAARALSAQKAKDAAAAVSLLSNAVQHETAMQHDAQQHLRSTTKAYTDAYNEWVKYGKSLSEDPSKAQRAHLAELAKNVSHAKTAYDQADATLTRVNATLDSHKKALSAAQIEADKLKNTVAELSRKWDEYYETQSQKMAEDLATADMTNAQKYAYFKQLLDQQSRDTAEGEKEAERLFGQELSAYKGMLHDKESALKSFTDRAVSFLDSFFQRGKKGTETLSKAFQDMIHAMEQALEKSLLMSMLGKLFGVPTQSFGSIFQSNLAGAFGLGALIPTGAGGNGAGGLAGALPALVSTPSGQALPVHIAGVNSSITGGGSGAIGAGGGGGFGGFLGGGGGELLSGLGIAGLGISLGQKMGGGVGGGIMGALGAGVGLNVALGGGMGLLGSGGLSSMLAMNPLLFGGVMLLGGLLGSGGFGPHWGDPSNYPDRSDGANYGKFVSNWNGEAGTFNGTTIGPDQMFAGKQNDMAAQMIAWAQANSSDPLAKRILGLGSSGTDLGIVNEHDGVFTLADGKTISVKDLESIGQQWQSQTGGSGSKTLPVYNVTHAFPDWNDPKIALGGNYTPSGPTVADRITGQIGNPNDQKKPDVNITVNVGGVVGMTKDDLVRVVSEQVGQQLSRNPQLTYMR